MLASLYWEGPSELPVVHSANGVVHAGYDWYGFLAAGVNSAFFVLPGVILFTWLISWGLWKLNRKNA